MFRRQFNRGGPFVEYTRQPDGSEAEDMGMPGLGAKQEVRIESKSIFKC